MIRVCAYARSTYGRLLRYPLLVATAAACGHAKARGTTDTAATARVCARPANGIVVGRETVAGFSTHATFGALRQQCASGKLDENDAAHRRSIEWVFPFVGATVTAVQMRAGPDDSARNALVPDFWTAAGDSVRMPDGELVPRTLGQLRARYGVAGAPAASVADDTDGRFAHSCRFPYLRFLLATNDTSRRLPDSSRIVRVDMAGADTATRSLCLKHLPVSER